MGAGVAAIIVAKEKDLIAHFRLAGALNPATAKSVTELRVDSGWAWNLLERRGIIREAGRGRYYLDELAWVAHQKRRRRIATTVLVVVALLAIAVLVSVR